MKEINQARSSIQVQGLLTDGCQLDSNQIRPWHALEATAQRSENTREGENARVNDSAVGC